MNNNRRMMWIAIALCISLVALLLTLFRVKQEDSQNRCPQGMTLGHEGQCSKNPNKPRCPNGLVKNKAGKCVRDKNSTPQPSSSSCPKGLVENKAGKCVRDKNSTPQPSSSSCPKGLVENRNGVCVKSNPASKVSWIYPSGKPSLPRVTTSPEKSPPVVETSRAGGGGVVDNPTNSPSSESGVTAPSASPIPTTPRPIPSNEGGSNNGKVGGF